MKRADPCPSVAGENWEGFHSEGFPLRSQGPQPLPGLPTLAPLPERGTPQDMAVKISGDSTHLGKVEGR